MKKYLPLLSLLFLISYTSCGSATIVNNVKKLEIGISKSEAIKIMGDDYRVVSAVSTPDGTLEILRYDWAYTYSYTLHFLDKKLMEYNEVPPLPMPPHLQQHQQQHNHD